MEFSSVFDDFFKKLREYLASFSANLNTADEFLIFKIKDSQIRF